MDEAQLIALAEKAISLHKTRGCLEYVGTTLEKRLRKELAHVGTLAAITSLLVNHVSSSGLVELRPETREEYQDRRECWFRVLVPCSVSPTLLTPLFFELELSDDDPDYPSVLIMNVHF